MDSSTAQGEGALMLRSRLWEVLHYGRGRAGRVVTFAIVVAILASIAILPLEFIEALRAYHPVLLTLEVVLTAIFTVEYLLRIYAAPQRRRYVVSFFGVIDFFSIAPFYVGLMGTQYLRVLRLARLIRLLKIAAIEAGEAAKEESRRGHELVLLPGEQVEYVVTKHPVFFLIGLVPPLIAICAALLVLLAFSFHVVAVSVGGTLLLFAAIFLWKAWLDYRYDVIYVTSHRLIFQNRHLLGSTVNQVDYRAITNIKPTYVGVLSYFLGFGSLVIETPAAETGRIEHSLVRSHERAAHAITCKCFGRSAPR